MIIYFYCSTTEVLVNNYPDRTYVPVTDIDQHYKNALYGEAVLYHFDDVDGFNLYPVFTDEIPERRNGLPSHAYTYSYNGTMRVFPLFNNDVSDVLAMKILHSIMVYPYTYILAYDLAGNTTYNEAGQAILALNNQNNVPSGVRVCFQDINTFINNGIGANREFDLNFSVYGV